VEYRTLRLLREFLLQVNAHMNAIPLPVPPRAPDEWDGIRLPTRNLYLSFNQLPAEVQQAVAPGFEQCLNALAQQGASAQAAQHARYAVFADLIDGLGLTATELVPDDFEIAPRPARANADEHGVVSEVEQYVRSKPAVQSLLARLPDTDDDPEPRSQLERVATAVEPPAATGARSRRTLWAAATAALAVAATVALLAWPAGAPQPAAGVDVVTINRAAMSGDISVVVSHAERRADNTAFYVHVINSGDRSQSAALSVEQGDIAPGASAGGVAKTPSPSSSVIPARSVQHRVLTVPNRPGRNSVNVKLRTLGMEDAVFFPLITE
jgi:hypothetical protein